AYIPTTLWEEVKNHMEEDLKSIKTGTPEDFTHFINAVIDEESFDKLAKEIADAQQSLDAEVIMGGNCDKSKGYFIEPTVILAKKPDYNTMKEELFGPILTVYVYDPDKLDETLDILDTTTDYALT
ncbi:MAG TPA: 1-pyrroline-5-carboxylate dehydrogenase, partial [Porphyromonadaceae bacterium]|nr:1-pyrroline-5-carboxylate dehydrogenase [Porphyromonadaceae bacterium]